MVTLIATFPTKEVSEIDHEGIKRVHELERMLNSLEQKQQLERVVEAWKRGDYEAAFQALKDKPYKYLLNPWKFK